MTDYITIILTGFATGIGVGLANYFVLRHLEKEGAAGLIKKTGLHKIEKFGENISKKLFESSVKNNENNDKKEEK